MEFARRRVHQLFEDVERVVTARASNMFYKYTAPSSKKVSYVYLHLVLDGGFYTKISPHVEAMVARTPNVKFRREVKAK